MKTEPASLVRYSPAAQCRELPSFSMVLLHDHELAAKAAQTTILRLLAGSLKQTDVHQDRWTFEELSHPKFRHEALELAASCDMMLLAAVNGESLPAHVISWIADWSRARVLKDAAFVFLSTSRNALAISEEQLSEVGAAEKLTLFASTLALPEPEYSTILQKQQGPFARVYNPQPEAWGINE